MAFLVSCFCPQGEKKKKKKKKPFTGRTSSIFLIPQIVLPTEPVRKIVDFKHSMKVAVIKTSAQVHII